MSRARRPQPTSGRAPSLDDFATGDAPMARCLELARVAARTELPVLILGESGSGKTLLASAIHHSSRRTAFAFVSFNAAALSETLLESQLFGHEKGAFTGADRRVKGKFELAHQGTLFLDEIADMSPSAQAKILRAVEYGEYERLGSESLEVADVRLVSATHHSLGRFASGHQFRQDLFYRISGITITIPPLRDRPHDLRALVAWEIEMAGREQGKTIRGLTQPAAQRLFAHAWPGNLRELKRVLQVAVALTEGDLIPPEALLIDAPDGRGDEGDPALDAAIRRHIDRVLESTGGNKRKAAKLLKISRSTLDRRLEN
jgi:transcriptional regulator with PAS, ATPase and Fis domain